MEKKRRRFNKVYLMLAVASILVGFCSAQMKVYAIDFETGKGDTAYLTAKIDGNEAAMEYIKACNTKYPGAIPASDIEAILNAGYLTEYVDELKALGYISAGYASSGSSTTSAPTQTQTETVPETVSEPTLFTVEDMEDTPMWAIQVVNYRDGASTEYAKLGSLAQYEQVIVNGVASTGWYRFITADGSTAYVSNSYLTTEDPNSSEMNISNEETEQADTYTLADTNPEEVDEVIETTEEEAVINEPAVEEPEPEPEPEEEITVEAEPEIKEEVKVEEESSSNSWLIYIFCVIGALCIIICIYYIIRKKSHESAE